MFASWVEEKYLRFLKTRFELFQLIYETSLITFEKTIN